MSELLKVLGLEKIAKHMKPKKKIKAKKILKKKSEPPKKHNEAILESEPKEYEKNSETIPQSEGEKTASRKINENGKYHGKAVHEDRSVIGEKPKYNK